MKWSVFYDARGKHIVNDDGSTKPYRWYHAAVDAVYAWWATRDWRRRQNEFKRTGTRYYGDGGTIHSSTKLDIGVDKNGRVVSVWFRCQPLPFRQNDVSDERAAEMRRMYAEADEFSLHGVEVRDPK